MSMKKFMKNLTKYEEEQERNLEYDNVLKSNKKRIKKNKIKKKNKKFTKEEINNIVKSFKSYGFIIYNDIKTYKCKSFNKDHQIKDIFKHCFIKYNVPNFLIEETCWGLKEYNNEFLKLTTTIFNNFIVPSFNVLTSGRSFYKDFGKEYFTKKECYIFINGNYNSVKKNFLYAKLKQYNLSSSINDFLINFFNNKCHRTMKTENFKYYIDIFNFIKRNEEYWNKNDFEEIYDYISRARINNQRISLKGRTWNSIIDLSNEWHLEQIKKQDINSSKWDGLGIDDFNYIEKRKIKNSTSYENVLWSFTQIKSSKELSNEGRQMKHCVSSYINSCKSGHCGIFKLESISDLTGFEKHLTIEINNNGKIVQVRGKCNRVATNKENSIIEKFKNQMVINYD